MDRPPDEEAPELLTVAEAAEILRCHKNTVYSQVRQYLVTDGATGIEAIKVGGQIRVLRRPLEKKLQIKIARIPPPTTPQARRAGQSQAQDSTSGRGDSEPSHAALAGSERASKAPIGYLGSLVAQWRLRR